MAAVKRMWLVLVAVGVALIVAGGVWFVAGEPDRSEVVTAEFDCELTNNMLGTDRDCEGVGPDRPVVGPVVVAALGGLLVVVGAVVSAGQARGGGSVSQLDRRPLVERMNERLRESDET